MTTPARLVALPRSAVTLAVIAACLGTPSFEAHARPADEPRAGRAPASPQLTFTSLLGPGPSAPLALAERSTLAGASARTRRLQEGQEPWSTIDACVREEMAAEDGPGAAIAVYQGGRIVYKQGYGVKEAGKDGAVKASTQFRIGSVTKMLTAAAVMQEVDAGRLDLDAPITDYVPELVLADEGAAKRIHTRHLLTHSSAYPDNVLLGLDTLRGGTDDATLATWVGTQTGTHVHAPPGTFWNYSNSGFTLAGLVAERASGVPYHRLMAERVFARAGLSHTTMLPAEVLARGDYAAGHWTNPVTMEQAVESPDSYDNWAVAPAGYAFSTVGDLVHWATVLMDGGQGVISTASAEAMQARQQAIGYYPSFDYGYGVFRERYKGLEIMQHGGNVPGWGAFLLWVPEKDFAVATLVNGFPATLDESAMCALEAVLKPEGGVGRPDKGDPAEMPGFVGDFGGWTVTGGSLRASIAIKGEGLEIVFPDIPIDAAGTPYRSDMVNAFGQSFGFDGDGDGKPETLLTFIPDLTDPDRLWLRTRSWVLSRPDILPPPSPTPPPTALPASPWDGRHAYLPWLGLEVLR